MCPVPCNPCWPPPYPSDPYGGGGGYANQRGMPIEVVREVQPGWERQIQERKENRNRHQFADAPRANEPIARSRTGARAVSRAAVGHARQAAQLWPVERRFEEER